MFHPPTKGRGLSHSRVFFCKPIRIEELQTALSKCQPKNFSEPIDPAALQVIREAAGEKADSKLAGLINVYLRSAAKLLQTMRAATDSGDAEALARAAHTLKSSSATMGAMALANLCKQLEALARTGTITDADSQVSQIEEMYESVKAALQAECQ